MVDWVSKFEGKRTNVLWPVAFKGWLGCSHLEVVKNLTIRWIDSSVGFNLILMFRYLQFKPNAYNAPLNARHVPIIPIANAEASSVLEVQNPRQEVELSLIVFISSSQTSSLNFFPIRSSKGCPRSRLQSIDVLSSSFLNVLKWKVA